MSTYLPNVLPEFEIDYTPLFIIPYDSLPDDLKQWEKRESWLLDKATKEAIKKLGGTLVAKSLDKSDLAKARKTWRVSLNPAPVFQRILSHLNSMGCCVKTVLKLIKDIKQVELVEEDRDFLKSYNIRQALLWSIHDHGGNHTFTSEELLLMILRKSSTFLEESFFPCFLENSRNLVFNLSLARCKEGHQRLEDIILNLDKIVNKVKQEQTNKKKELDMMSKTITQDNAAILPLRSMIIEVLTTTWAANTIEAFQIIESKKELSWPCCCCGSFSKSTNEKELRRYIREFLAALFSYLLDRNRAPTLERVRCNLL